MPDDAVRAFRPDRRSGVVALTHDPKLDDLALLEALESDAFYVGAIGSRRNQRARRARLAEHFSLGPSELGRLRGPIGLYIGSKTPPEIAVSVMAEIVAVARGATSRRSGERRGGARRGGRGPAAWGAPQVGAQVGQRRSGGAVLMRHGSAADPGRLGQHARRRAAAHARRGRLQRGAGRAARATGVALDVIVGKARLVRGRQTAALVSGRLGAPLVVDGRPVPGRHARAHLVRQRYREAGALLFVGHEPDMSRLVAALIGGGRIHFRPGSLARVRAEWDGGDRLAGRLLWLPFPPAPTTEDRAGRTEARSTARAPARP
jgi:xanthine/CO dehydrogenase XdhC/CoxF family maturation factor